MGGKKEREKGEIDRERGSGRRGREREREEEVVEVVIIAGRPFGRTETGGMKRKVLGGRSAKPQGGASRLDPAALIGRERGAVAGGSSGFYLTGDRKSVV